MDKKIYAQFTFQGKVVSLNKRVFDQALADSQYCSCHRCLCCAVRQYRDDAIKAGNYMPRG